MPADGLTKALTAQKHYDFLKIINMVDIRPRLAKEQASQLGLVDPPELESEEEESM